MSLIQQALERTGRAQKIRMLPPAPPQKPRVPYRMDAALEKEVLRIQRCHAKRKSFFWKIFSGVLVTFLCGALIFFWIQSRNAASEKLKTEAIARVSEKIYDGYLYRLTGITLGGEKNTAVINNRIVGVGDWLNRKTVVQKIQKGEVLLDIQGEELYLSL